MAEYGAPATVDSAPIRSSMTDFFTHSKSLFTQFLCLYFYIEYSNDSTHNVSYFYYYITFVFCYNQLYNIMQSYNIISLQKERHPNKILSVCLFYTSTLLKCHLYHNTYTF